MKTILHALAMAAGIQVTAAFEVHEWGTFTTVAGSDGIQLEGLQREEETLPPYVHAHFGFENGQQFPLAEWIRLQKRIGFTGFHAGAKGLGRRPVAGVTVKMETPVIYFHSPVALSARVKVGFEGGTISQWYPGRSGGEILPEPTRSVDGTAPVVAAWTMDFSRPYRGGIEWEIDVLSPAESHEAMTFKPADSINWLRARVPEANTLRTATGETENYLFYRGIGNFDAGLRISVSNDETLHLKNLTGGTIPFLLAFEKRGSVVRWRQASSLAADGALEIPENTLVSSTPGQFPTAIYQSIRDGLQATGLTRSESDAMVQTWWTSYFETDGLRVFWVLPQLVTDRVLPLEITPAPNRIVRVLVGRSEVLRPRAESEMLSLASQTGEAAAAWKQLVATDRFGLAYQNRIEQLRAVKTARR